jgi:hypothetical protein
MVLIRHAVVRANLAGLVLTCLWSGPISAAPSTYSLSTGNDLLVVCEDEASNLSIGACYGFILGVLSRDRLAGELSPGGQIVCLPANVRNSQTKDVVVQYLKSHPNSRHYEAGQLVMQALDEAFGSNRFACVQSPKAK